MYKDKGGGGKHMNKESLMKYLKENFGIENERDFAIAFRNMQKLNIGIMTTKEKEGDGIAGAERAEVC